MRDDILLHDRLAPYAPHLYVYELSNGIVSAVRRRRLEQEQGDQALRNLLAVEVTLRTPALERSYEIAVELGLSAYDSAYVALAEQLDAHFWTADRGLYDATNRHSSRVLWIGDYRSEGRAP